MCIFSTVFESLWTCMRYRRCFLKGCVHLGHDQRHRPRLGNFHFENWINTRGYRKISHEQCSRVYEIAWGAKGAFWTGNGLHCVHLGHDQRNWPRHITLLGCILYFNIARHSVKSTLQTLYLHVWFAVNKPPPSLLDLSSLVLEPFYVSYMRHYNTLLIRSRSWITNHA